MLRQEDEPGQLFRLQVTGGPGRVLIVVAGELDLATTPELREAILGAVDAGDDDVAVDLSAVNFIDSTGLSVLIMGHKRLGALGRRLLLRSPSREVRRLLKISGLDTTFLIDG